MIDLDNYVEHDEYRERDESSPKKVLIIILIIILSLIGIFFLIKYLFFGASKEDILLEASKEYFSKEESELPSIAGESVVITLDELLDNKLISSKSKFKKCDNEKTFVKVYKLESGKIHYVPLFTCDDIKSDSLYNEWIYGEESDIIEDISDVNYLFVPKIINEEKIKNIETKEVVEKENTYKKYYTVSESKGYRYRDMSWLWEGNIRKYYPNDETDINKVTYTSVTSPSSEYNNKSSKISVKYYSTKTTPSTCTSKTEFQVISKSTYTAPKAIYGCYYLNPDIPAYLFQDCASAGLQSLPNYTIKYTCGSTVQSETVSKDYKCNATCSSGLTLSSDRSSCGKYVCPSVWSDWTKTACTGGTSVCKSKTETEYKWYKIENGTTSEYFAKAPYEGLTKKGEGKLSNWSKWSTTKVTANETREVEESKLLKIKVVPEDVEDYWTPLSNVPVTLEEMIETFKEKGYEVETLEDIYNHNSITYGLVLQYRNKK